MRRTAVASFLFIAAAVTACSKSSSTPMVDVDAPPFPGAQTFTITWGPIDVPAGVEKTQCIWANLTNDAEVKIHSMHNLLLDGSHHLIVYRDNDPADAGKIGQPPVDCQAFTGALNQSGMIAPMMITQKQDDALTLPDTVAYTLAPHQLIKLELHYINRDDSASKSIGATVNFMNADPSTIQNEADILFIGSLDIGCSGTGCTHITKAAPMATLHQFFDPNVTSLGADLADANFFAITGHEHQWGTNVQVGVGAKGGTMAPVYNPAQFTWSEPVTQQAAPPFKVGAGQGFDFQCNWNYTPTDPNAPNEVSFGESANDEMCFFWAYYYPSKGAHVCIHSDHYGADACCPGDGICSLVGSQF